MLNEKISAEVIELLGLKLKSGKIETCRGLKSPSGLVEALRDILWQRHDIYGFARKRVDDFFEISCPLCQKLHFLRVDERIEACKCGMVFPEGPEFIVERIHDVDYGDGCVDIKCICGNIPESEGFHLCRIDGEYDDDVPVEDFYRCASCDRIIHMDSRLVIKKL